VVVAALGLSLVIALDSDPSPAGANPAFGTVKLAPTTPPFTGFIVLENHSFSVPIQFTTCADSVTAPSFTAESAGATTITDLNAAWSTNQWAGYDIQLTSGTGSPQWRTVVSNTATVLTLDSAWGGVVDTGTATAGSTTTVVDAGSGWLNNEFATDLGDNNPAFTIEFTGPEGLQTRTITGNTADTLTVTPAYATNVTDTATGGTASTLVDTSVTWTTNQWANKSVQITAGAAAGQSRRVLSNTNNTLTIEGTWTTAGAGSATSGTSTTMVDATQAWTVNAFAGMTVDLLVGTGAPQSATIASNTATTLTISGTFAPAPDFGTIYRILQAPTATSQYIVRDGASINSTFQIKQTSPVPTAGTVFELFKSACRVGGYDVIIGYNDTKLDVITDGGITTAGNTVTTFNDTSKSWKLNQWVGSRITITGGASIGQTQIVVANTKTQLTLSPGWNTTPPNTVPGAGAYYTVGGVTDAGWVEGTTPARTLNCPGGQIFGPSTAQLRCVTFGAPSTGLPQGRTGTGNLLNLSLTASGGRGLVSFTLTTLVLEVDGSTIPADTVNGSRRIILCPDSAPSPTPDGVVNVGDMLKIAQAFGQSTGDPLYTVTKDPDENGNINAGDQLATVSVFQKKCVQPLQAP
jgi:hypothetical protein